MAAVRFFCTVFIGLLFAIHVHGQQYPAEMLSGLQWRDVGPMRGGRTYGVAGHAAQPDTFYIGSVGGGVWKTENSGRTWFPISDDPQGIPIGSIGAIAVAPSESQHRLRRHRRARHPQPALLRHRHVQIHRRRQDVDATSASKTRARSARVVVDPADPNRVYVAALGHVYEPNPERGVYRSTDGGATWKKILVQRQGSRTTSARSTSPSIRKNPRRALRFAVGHAPSAMVGLRALQHARRRPLQIHRRRRHLEATHRRPAHRRLRRQDRHRRRAQQSQPPLGRGRRHRRRRRAARSRRRRAAAERAETRRRRLSLRRRRRHLETGQQRDSASGAAAGTSARSPSTPPIPTAPTSSTPPPT